MSDAARVEQYFGRAGELFDSMYDAENAASAVIWPNRLFRRDMYERFRLTLDHVQGHRLQSVLDVGCGSGRYEVGLAGIGVRKIVALDVSPGMIQLARENTRNRSEMQASLEFVQQDFAAFQASGTFVAIFSM